MSAQVAKQHAVTREHGLHLHHEMLRIRCHEPCPYFMNPRNDYDLSRMGDVCATCEYFDCKRRSTAVRRVS